MDGVPLGPLRPFQSLPREDLGPGQQEGRGLGLSGLESGPRLCPMLARGRPGVFQGGGQDSLHPAPAAPRGPRPAHPRSRLPRDQGPGTGDGGGRALAEKLWPPRTIFRMEQEVSVLS